jgi:hypothetical protein
MKNNSTVVATVIHNKSLNNLNLLLDSIYLQDDQKFDLLVLNDTKKKLIFRRNKSIKILSFKYEKNINENRIKLIKEIIKRKYKKVIFIDSDDSMTKDRIGFCKKFLKRYKIVVNDLNIFSESHKLIKKNYLSSRIKNGLIINKIDLNSKNFLGMSNTACCVTVLKKINLNILKNAPIFDWALWVLALQHNSAVFINATATNYLINKKSVTYFYNNNKKTLLKRKKIKDKQIKFFIKNNLFKKKEVSKEILKSAKNKFWWE